MSLILTTIVSFWVSLTTCLVCFRISKIKTSGQNPLGYQTDFAAEMAFVHDYAESRNLENYQVYFLGNSNGAVLGIINAYRVTEIKKLEMN